MADQSSGWRPYFLNVALRELLHSLTFRAVAFSSVWAIIALIVIASIITALYRQVSHRSFDAVLSAHIFNLIATVSVSPDGRLTGHPNLGDLRFSEPASGWYWAVEPISKALHNELLSASLAGDKPPAAPSDIPFDTNYQRSYVIEGQHGQMLGVVETEVTLGQDDSVARFRVMGNRSELEAEIAQFNYSVLVYLGIFGFGMVVINVLAILLGLRPLMSIREALAKIREGKAETLGGQFPREIAPLALETNALIDSNKRIIERSRKQVGNLAHSLKTPLTVILNEGRIMGDERGDLLAHQAEVMQEQIELYLQKARTIAQGGMLLTRTNVNETLSTLTRVMKKISPDTSIDLSLPKEQIIFAGEQGDLEELIGNLVENAVQWSKRQVKISLSRVSDSEDDKNCFYIIVEDDGPGIPDELARQVLKRGKRLDESKKGSGLGLSIVADMVDEYAGRIDLSRSSLGGLSVRVFLKLG